MRLIISVVTLVILIAPSTSYAVNLIGRMGIGMSQQLPNSMDTISLKLQNSRASALGAFFGLDSGTGSTDYAIGLKSYRIIYEEPQLNFYMAGTGGLLQYQDALGDEINGYIVEGSFGAEFHLQGLESIGFSFEFGVGLHKLGDGTSFKTVGHDVLRSAVHFYL
jgi:hypothetical protein